MQIQQLFPSFPEATIEGDTYRVERCISCHVPDIGTVGPVQAAQRLSKDFFKYEPNAKQLDRGVPPHRHSPRVHHRDRR